MPFDVDTSSYPKPGPPVNALQMAQQAVQLGQGATNLEKSNLELRALKAAGPLYQQSIGPDGKVDHEKFVSLVAKNPATAILAPQLVQQGFQNKNLDMEGLQKRLTLDITKNNQIGDTAMGLADQYGENVTMDHVRQGVSRLVKSGVIDEREAGSALAQLSTARNGRELNQMLQVYGKAAMGAAQTLQKSYEGLGMVDTGGGVQQTQKKPGPMGAGGGMTIGGLATKTLSPESRNAQTPGVTPMGVPFTVPRQDAGPVYSGSGQPEIPPTSGNGNQPRASSPSSAGEGSAGMGAPPARPMPTPQPRPSIGGVPALSGLPPTAIQTGLSREGTGGQENQVTYAKDLIGQAQGASESLKYIGELRKLLQKDPTLTQGGNTFKESLGRLAQALGLGDNVVRGIVGGPIENRQAAQKMLFKLLGNDMRTIFGSQTSNMELATAIQANPSLETDPRAVEKMLQLIETAAQAKVAEEQAYEKWKEAKGTGVGFQAFWHKYALTRYYGLHQNESGQWVAK